MPPRRSLRSIGSHPLAAVALAAGVAALGQRARALSPSGAVAATVVGSAFLQRRDPRTLAALGVFFVSGSTLSRLHTGARTSAPTPVPVPGPEDIVARSSQRDAWQVLANGGVAALSVLATGHTTSRTTAATLGALAAATADTWATEIGQHSPTQPRMFLARTPAPPGTSGAVTQLGLLGSLAGSVTIALLAVGQTQPAWRRPIAVAAAGVSGALADTVLGELVQERRHCPACGTATEARVHRCGTATTHVGGVPGLTNDVVNLLCTLVGAGAAFVLANDAER